MTQVGALPPPAAQEETVRLLAPTLMVAPPAPPPPPPARPAAARANQAEPVVIPATRESVAPRQYPGVRAGGAVASILLGSAALGVAAGAADASNDRSASIAPGCLPLPSSATQDDAIAALVILGGAAVLTLSLVLLAIWAARQSNRARMSVVRGFLGLVAIVVAGVAAGALVWTANAGSTAGISELISSAGL